MTSAMNSPTGMDLFPEPPSVRRVSRRIVLVVVGALTIVMILIVYGVQRRKQAAMTEAGSSVEKIEPAVNAGRSVAAAVPLGNLAVSKPGGPRGSEPQRMALQDPTANPVDSQVNVRLDPPTYAGAMPPVVTYPGPPPEVQYRQLQQEQEQRAIESPTGIGGQSAGSGTQGFGSTPQVDLLSHPSPSNPQGIPSHEPDSQSPELQQTDKDAFIAQARREKPLSENYVSSTRTAPLSKYEIKAGWDIPAILEQELNSDLPGEIRSRVREDVYDTATGKYLLVPHGSILVGYYNSHVAYGQSRLQVVWSRIIFPDASSVNLDGMIGQDAGGASGLGWKVNNHYIRMASFAVLTSLFSAGFQLSQPRQGNTVFQTPSSGQIIAGAVGQNVSQLGAEVTRKNLNIPPTITVPTGFRFNVRVNRDLIFSSPYTSLSRN